MCCSINAKIPFATGAVRFICLLFYLRFSGIVGMTVGYGLCVYIYTALCDFYNGPVQSRRQTVQRS